MLSSQRSTATPKESLIGAGSTMRATLCVVAITTLSTIWTGTVKADPREEAILNFLEDLLKADKISATITSRDDVVRMPFHKAANSDANVVDLVLKEVPQIMCSDLEIMLNDDGPVFQNPHTISLEVYKDTEDKQKMRLIMHFESKDVGLLKLYVPVFEVPPFEYLEGDSRLLRWAEFNGVVALSPFNDLDLISLASGDTVNIYFMWLKSMEKYGLYRYQESSSNEYSAWTRPLLLRQKVIREFINLWKKFKGTVNSGTS